MAHCTHGDPERYAPDEVIEKLPICQAQAGRHKCPVCAYLAGIEAGEGRQFEGPASQCQHAAMPREVVNSLPIYQGSKGRHGCVYTAYQAGLEEGRRRSG